MRKCNVGGQAVMEGVMMKSPDAVAIAVRKEDGSIVTEYEKHVSWSSKHKLLGLPIIRGVANFVEMMALGMRTLTRSAKMLGIDEEPPSKLDEYVAEKTGAKPESIMIGFAVALALVLMVGLFFVLPTLVTRLLTGSIASVLVKNLVEGLIRLTLFIGYVTAISFMKDIKRVFMYHGAEHKTIACFEHDEELTSENARKFKRLHPRCGTNYMLLVIVVSILVFSLFGWSTNPLLRVALRLAMLPVIAGLAYELLKVAAKYENFLTRAIRAPGMLLQRLTTREPDDSMLEVAIVAFKMAIDNGAYMVEQVLQTKGQREDAPADSDTQADKVSEA